MVTGTFVVCVNKHETVLVQRHRMFSTRERRVFVDSLSFMDFEVLPEEGVQGEVVV